MNTRRYIFTILLAAFTFQGSVFAENKDVNDEAVYLKMLMSGGASESASDGLPLTPKDDKWGEPNNGFAAQLIPQSKEYVLGKPMNFGLVLKNVSDSMKQYDNRHDFMNPLTITDANDNEAYYKRGPFQTNQGPTRSIDAGEVATLFANKDITKDYVIIKPGKYTIQFQDGSEFPASNVVEFEVKPGTPDGRDLLIASVIDILPDANWLARINPRDNTPAGRKGAEGNAIVLYRIRSRIRVMIWQTKTPAEVDEKGEDPQTSEYLGKNASGYFYITIPPKALDYWPKMKENITNALKLDSQSDGPK